MMLLPLFRAVHIGTCMLIGGAVGFEFLILRRTAAACDRSLAPAIRRWLDLQCTLGVALALLSWAGWLAALAVSMSGLEPAQALTPEVLGTVVIGTTFGHVWAIRLGLLLALAGALTWRRHERRIPSSMPGPTAAALALGLVLSLAWTGHALGAPAPGKAVDAVHALAAAVWLGMIPPLWLVVRRGTSAPWKNCATSAASAFFWPGALSVAALAATGVANSLRMVDSPGELASTRYGLLLAGKIALFAVMLTLAARNRVLTSRLDKSGDAGDCRAAMVHLRRSVAAELACGTAVIALVGALGATAPPARHNRIHAAPHSHEAARSSMTYTTLISASP